MAIHLFLWVLYFVIIAYQKNRMGERFGSSPHLQFVDFVFALNYFLVIIIIEDQLPELKLAATFPDPLTALAFLREHKIDLIFLDIHLPKLSGMDFLKVIPQKFFNFQTLSLEIYKQWNGLNNP